MDNIEKRPAAPSATERYMPQHIKRWTLPTCYAGEHWPDYYSSGFGRSRDSDALERSNFRVALKALGGESETVIVVRESHWAVGWVEWIAIHESDETTLRKADELRDRTDQYPPLDENDWSEEEHNEAQEIWSQCYDWRDRVRYIREHESQFEFQSLADMLGCVRGNYFAGYDSELIR